jgi:phage terminase large subunit-like protein
MNHVEAYARSVVAGEVPAGKYHRLSCARHLGDLERQGTPEFPYRFDLKRAERFWRFAEQLKHYKGEWAGQLVRLQPYQKFRLGSVFGWVHVETGLRRFRNAYHELPRKQGKSLEAAIVTLYVTFFDGEAGAEGYCAATKRDQALIVFGDCRKLVLSSGLKDRLVVQTYNIHHDGTHSKLEPLSSDFNSMDGLNPNMVNLDELHAYKNRGTIDVLETATGARRQPLVNKITTAGDDPVSVCGDEHDYACKVLDGTLVDETYFAFIAHADPEDDWKSLDTAKKANPNYGVSVNPADLESKIAKAIGIPSAAASYQQKHLNLWVNTSAPSLSVDGWRKGQSTWKWDELEHESCWVGIDLSSKIDLTAMSLVFPPTPGRPKWRLIQHIWTPEDTIDDRAHRDRAPYRVWVDQGWLKTMPGTSISQDIIRETLLEMRERFDIECVGFDPWHADTLIDQMKKHDGWTEEQVLEVPQTFASLTSAEARFKAEVLAGHVDAGGCPVTAWAVSNVVDQTDGKDNILFSKKRSRGRIDPVKAATIGMSLYLRRPEETEPKFQMLMLGTK